jgi:hypothetical protein
MTKVELGVDHNPAQGTRHLFAESPVRIGGDVMMLTGSVQGATTQGGRDNRRGDNRQNTSSLYDQLLVSSFASAPRGKRTRWASVLAGNMYLASEFASQAKVGQSVLYTDDRGMRQRAIVLSAQFEAAKLRYMPVRVWVRRAMEELMLELSGLSPDRVQRDEQGNEVPGQPPCEPNGADGAFVLHTSFARAWSYSTGASSHAHAPDDLLIVPGRGISVLVTKEQHRRLAASMRAAQDRIRSEEAERIALLAQAAAPAAAATGQEAARAITDEAAPDQAAPDQALPAGQAPAADQGRPARGAGRGGARARLRAADDPEHVVISASDKARRGDRQGRVEAIALKADTPAKMRRAIRLLVEGAGLQLYVQRSGALGSFARDLVRTDLIRRLRDEIGDNPQKLARLEEQIERMDSEAAASRRGFVDLARAGVGRAEDQVLVERGGQMMTERDLFSQEEAQEEQQLEQDQAQAQEGVVGRLLPGQGERETPEEEGADPEDQPVRLRQRAA